MLQNKRKSGARGGNRRRGRRGRKGLLRLPSWLLALSPKLTARAMRGLSRDERKRVLAEAKRRAGK